MNETIKILVLPHGRDRCITARIDVVSAAQHARHHRSKNFFDSTLEFCEKNLARFRVVFYCLKREAHRLLLSSGHQHLFSCGSNCGRFAYA